MRQDDIISLTGNSFILSSDSITLREKRCGMCRKVTNVAFFDSSDGEYGGISLCPDCLVSIADQIKHLTD
jgi:hypothetical protein